MTDNRCLVTGGTGFLGRHVVRALREAGHEITLLSRAPVEGCKTVLADLASPDLDLHQSTSNGDYSTIYHLAGLAHVVPRTEAEGEKFFQVNAEGTGNLLRALERASRLPESVVLISTVAVYGVEEGTLLDEKTPRNATDPYGSSKRKAEDTLTEWGGRHGVRTAVVRLPLVIGKDAPGNFGTMVQALKQGKYLGIGAGSARRSMVLASDVADILPRIAQENGVFHLTDGHHPSFAELERALVEALHKEMPKRLPMGLAKFGARAGDGVQRVTGRRMPLTSRTLSKMASTLTFSDEPARRVLGWGPSRVLDHMAELVS